MRFYGSLLSRMAVWIGCCAILLLPGCGGLKQHTDLSQVKFTLDRISDVSIAGIDVSQIQSPEKLDMFQLARASLALSQQNLPLLLTLHVKSENPLANAVAARLIRMDWTLVLDGRDTISGTMDNNLNLPAGGVESIPLRVSVNMFDYFNEKSAMDMLNLALAFAGSNGAIPKGVALKVMPTIDTVFGPIRYDKGLLIQPQEEHPAPSPANRS